MFIIIGLRSFPAAGSVAHRIEALVKARGLRQVPYCLHYD